jgi:predicted transcriptional regulator
MLNSYERIVIDSLLKKPKTIEKLITDSDLSETSIQNTLMSLLTKGFIKKELNLYEVFRDRLVSYQQSDESKEDLLSERELLFSSLIREHQKLNIHKVYLSKEDKAILKGLIHNLESFLRGLNNEQNHQTKDETLIIYGENNYVSTIKNIIS